MPGLPIEIPMKVENDEHGVPRITYTPPTGADFKPIDVVIPRLEVTTAAIGDLLLAVPHPDDKGPSDESKFRLQVRDEVRQCCGFTACRSDVSFASSGLLNDPSQRIIIGSTIICSAGAECPLDPPSAGDGAILPDSPPPPSSLEAEVPLLVS